MQEGADICNGWKGTTVGKITQADAIRTVEEVAWLAGQTECLTPAV